jgi:hypothetical protein
MIDTERQMGGAEANGRRQGGDLQIGDLGFIGDWGDRDRRPECTWLCRILVEARLVHDRAFPPVDTRAPSHRSRSASRGYGRRYDARGTEILGAITHENGAVELRVAADTGVVPGIETLPLWCHPGLFRVGKCPCAKMASASRASACID